MRPPAGGRGGAIVEVSVGPGKSDRDLGVGRRLALVRRDVAAQAVLPLTRKDAGVSETACRSQVEQGTWPGRASRSQQYCGHDSDAVRSAVGVSTGRDDDGVQHIVTELIAQPAEVPYVVVSDGVGELHFDREHAVVPSFDDEVDLVLAPMRSEVADSRLCSLRIHPDVERDQ